MGSMQLKKEALGRQGTRLQCDGRTLRISGGPSAAEFESGREGLVHLATDESTGEKFRIKCFFDPHATRRQRSEKLVGLELPNLRKTKADALGGAPFKILQSLGPLTPFALVMKNVRGQNWRDLRDLARTESQYPPSWWPSIEVRATWAYGLATAVMKMEAQGFIHADLSPGNVVVNDGMHGIPGADHASGRFGGNADESGDMALVDFDRYVHLPGDMPDPGQGTEGYAAPEIWNMEVPSVGSDRTALAILTQEFLIAGAAEISQAESFDWSYNQEFRCFDWSFAAETGGSDKQGYVHPLLERKYPSLAALVGATLAAPNPGIRPAPQSWRGPLLDIVESTPARPDRLKARGMAIKSHPIDSSLLRLSFPAAKESLDLSATEFGIRANLERDVTGSAFLVVHNGASLNVQFPETRKWVKYPGNARIPAEVGMVLFDNTGRSNARLDWLK